MNKDIYNAAAYDEDEGVQSIHDWTIIKHCGIRIRVDYVRCNTPVQYLQEGKWCGTPWQTADVRHWTKKELGKEIYAYLHDC